MYARYEHGPITWIDLESPSRSDVTKIIDEFGIESYVAEELLLPSSKARAEYYSEYLYVVLHFPALRHSHKTREQEMDFIVGKDFIITTHYDLIDPLHKFAKLFETQALLHARADSDHAGQLFASIVKKLYKSVDHEVEFIRQHLHDIEDHIFSNRYVEMVSAISASARDLLNLRHTIEPHREVHQALEICAPHIFGQEFMPVLKALSGEYYRVHNHIVRETESLHELRETNNTLLTTKQNETLRIFTTLAFFTFPLTLVTTILAVPSAYNPIHDLPYDFWIIVLTNVVLILLMSIWFRKKGWI